MKRVTETSNRVKIRKRLNFEYQSHKTCRLIFEQAKTLKMRHVDDSSLYRSFYLSHERERLAWRHCNPFRYLCCA